MTGIVKGFDDSARRLGNVYSQRSGCLARQKVENDLKKGYGIDDETFNGRENGRFRYISAS